MVQQLEELVQHDGDGGDAHAVLQGAGSAASRAASMGATLGVGGYSSRKRTGTRGPGNHFRRCAELCPPPRA